MSASALPRRTRLAGYKRYPEYKDSGIEWLGQIPTHWALVPIYARYEVALGKMLDAKRATGESPGRYVRNIDVQWDAVNIGDLPEMDFAPWERDRYRLHPGDLLVCEGGEVGRTAIWVGEIEECFYQKAIHRVRPHSSKESPRFFYYFMHTLAQCGVFVASGNPNTIDHLTAVQLRHYRLPFPMAQEQRTIAAFLDRETAKIDDLIAKKERLIDLLQEKRTALFTRAVTKGLDPDVPMKDSGVEWIGQVPAHWTLKRIKHLVSPHDGIQLGPFGGMLKDLVYEPTPYKLYGQENTIADDFEAGSRWLREEHFQKLREYDLRSGDVVLTRKGASIGNCRIVPAEIQCGIIDSDTVRVRFLDSLIDTEFAVLLMHDAYLETEILAMEKGAVLPGLNTGTIANLRVALPPVPEQHAILGSIRQRRKAVDALILEVWEGSHCFAELRAALISAAVTGKIDVRGEVA